MRVPLLVICFFLACAAYASPVDRSVTQHSRPVFKRSPPEDSPSKGGRTSGNEIGAEPDCKMGPIQKLWNSERVFIGTTGSGTHGALYQIKGEAGKKNGMDLLIKRITRFSTGTSEVPDKNHDLEVAVRRDAFGNRILHQLAVLDIGVDRQPEGQDIYYIVIYKMGDRARETRLEQSHLTKLERLARERVSKGVGLNIELWNSDFLFHKNRHGNYDMAFPVELSNARLEDSKFEQIAPDHFPVETFKKCGVKP